MLDDGRRMMSVVLALLLPDDSTVVLDAVFVGGVSGQYASIRDMWVSSQSLLISSDAALQFGWTVKVIGEMTTVNGNRMLIADSAMMYVITNGGPAPPLPPCLLTEVDGISLVNVPTGSAQSNIVESTPEFDGSISSAKQAGGEVTLSGKVVTAVFHDTTGAVVFFYVQEPIDSSYPNMCGIKVVPQFPVPVEAGNIVEIEGAVVPGLDTMAECYFDARSVKCTANKPIPKPLGLNQRATAGADFGSQQMLYRVTPVIGRRGGGGLSVVGTRVSLWGKVTSVNSADHSFWMDDGSTLKSTVTNARTGIHVIYDDTSATLPSVNAYVPYTPGVNPTRYDATGVLGAEMDDNGCPVPVLRVPKRPSVPAGVVYVAENGQGTGASWQSPLGSLQDAIDAASTANPLKEVWVAAGTYTGNFTLADGVALYGGFAGNEEQREDRDWATNETILDGDGLDTVITIIDCDLATTRVDGFTIQNGWATFHYSAYTALCGGGIRCLGSAPTISHNVFLDNAAFDWESTSYGGGVYGYWSSPVIWSNEFGRDGDPNAANYGSALALEECDVESRVLGNTIHYNQVDYNSDTVYLYDTSASVCGNFIAGSNYAIDIIFLHSTWPALIQGNTITGNAWSGVYCGSGAITVCDNVITGNGGAGVSHETAADTQILRNTITGNGGRGVSIASFPACPVCISHNTITGNGGGIQTTGADADISYNTVSENTTAGSTYLSDGAGIYCGGGSPQITHNIIQNNQATCYVNEGGGIMCDGYTYPGMCDVLIAANVIQDNYGCYHGGGIAMHYVPTITIVNNLFVRNHTDGSEYYGLGGGAIHGLGSAPVIVNNTFVENWVGPSAWSDDAGDMTLVAYGGAIHMRDNYSTPATVVNNIFYDNRAAQGQSVACTQDGNANVAYCDTCPCQGQVWCYHSDPPTQQFPDTTILVDALTSWYVDPSFSGSNYWLSSSSLLRTTYHGTSSSPAPPADIEGRLRPGADGFTDMGVYENDGQL